MRTKRGLLLALAASFALLAGGPIIAITMERLGSGKASRQSSGLAVVASRRPVVFIPRGERSQITDGTPATPDSLVEEARFSVGQELRRVFSGSSRDGRVKCLITRRGTSLRDGAYLCGEDLFGDRSAAMLETFSRRSDGTVTDYEVTILLAPEAAGIAMTDSVGTRTNIETSGRIAHFTLPEEALRVGTILGEITISSETGAALSKIPVRGLREADG